MFARSSHLSQKSSVMRHILAYLPYCQALSIWAGPGERLSTMSRPDFSMASWSILVSCQPLKLSFLYIQLSQISSHLMKSTPQSAYIPIRPS